MRGVVYERSTWVSLREVKGGMGVRTLGRVGSDIYVVGWYMELNPAAKKVIESND